MWIIINSSESHDTQWHRLHSRHSLVKLQEDTLSLPSAILPQKKEKKKKRITMTKPKLLQLQNSTFKAARTTTASTALQRLLISSTFSIKTRKKKTYPFNSRRKRIQNTIKDGILKRNSTNNHMLDDYLQLSARP